MRVQGEKEQDSCHASDDAVCLSDGHFYGQVGFFDPASMPRCPQDMRPCKSRGGGRKGVDQICVQSIEDRGRRFEQGLGSAISKSS